MAVAWSLSDEGDEYAVAALNELRHGGAIVPHLWGLEVVNALLIAERRGRISANDVDTSCRLLMNLPIAVEPLERARAFTTSMRVARARGLTSYDASYLDLSVRFALPLATLDDALAAAAEEEGVGHWRPESRAG